ncbi:XkdX family protein [Clostridium sp. UBA6640]|nr:XkdX family protein [Clostridium sp. UBA6640]
MFNFYKLFYSEKYLSLEDLKEAQKWGVLTVEEFKSITDKDYITE